MNTTVIFIVIVLGSLAIIGIMLWVINRSWGDFPRRVGGRLDMNMSVPSISPEPVTMPTFQDIKPPTNDRILITHPMIRRAAESALYQNSPQARYIVRDGDQLYFAVDRIADPQQRAQAVDLMNRFQAGQHIDMSVVMRLIALLDQF